MGMCCLFLLLVNLLYLVGVHSFQIPTNIRPDVRSTHFRYPASRLAAPIRNEEQIWKLLRAIPRDEESSDLGDYNQSDQSRAKVPSKDESVMGKLWHWVKALGGEMSRRTWMTSAFLALFLRIFIVEPRYIPSASMYPTLHIGDYVAVEKVTKRIRPLQREEVVVFSTPQKIARLYSEAGRAPPGAYIKRIVAVAGDEVQMKDGKLYVNGIEQNESYTAEEAAYSFGPVIVPAGKVLVLGDNRNKSLDSHIWGFLPEDHVIGRAIFKYWPISRAGKVGLN